MKPYKFHRDNRGPSNRVNEQIRLSPILLIDENGNKVGVISNRDALAKAREVGLDLVEVSPNVRPPVCRIMDYGKFKYEQSIKEKKQKPKASQVKEVRFRPSIGDADVQTKIRSIRSFLEDGQKVQIRLEFKARENAHKDLGYEVVKKVTEAVADIATTTMPRSEGRFLSCLIELKRKSIGGKDELLSEAQRDKGVSTGNA